MKLFEHQVNFWAHMLDEAMNEKSSDKAIIVIDTDLLLYDNIIVNYNVNNAMKKNARHSNGETFIEQIFVVDKASADRLIDKNLFYSNFMNDRSILDELDGLNPVDGVSSGVKRMAGHDVTNDLADRITEILKSFPDAPIYRFVSPQAYMNTKTVILDLFDNIVIDTHGLTKIYKDGHLIGLKDEATGEITKAGEDFLIAIPAQIFGYWQKIDPENMEADDIQRTDFKKDTFVPGMKLMIRNGEMKKFINFIENRKQFLKNYNKEKPQQPLYKEQFLLRNMLYTPYGKNVGFFDSIEDAFDAAKSDFQNYIDNGWVFDSKPGSMPKPDELTLNQRNNGIFAPPRKWFKYIRRPGQGTPQQVNGWSLSLPIYVIIPQRKRI